MGDGGTQGAGPMQVEIKKEGRRGQSPEACKRAPMPDAGISAVFQLERWARKGENRRE